MRRPIARCASASSDSVPPSPRLSALHDEHDVLERDDHDERPEQQRDDADDFALGEAVPPGGAQALAQRVERAGADVAVDDADRSEHQLPESGGVRSASLGRGWWRSSPCLCAGCVKPACLTLYARRTGLPHEAARLVFSRGGLRRAGEEPSGSEPAGGLEPRRRRRRGPVADHAANEVGVPAAKPRAASAASADAGAGTPSPRKSCSMVPKGRGAERGPARGRSGAQHAAPRRRPASARCSAEPGGHAGSGDHLAASPAECANSPEYAAPRRRWKSSGYERVKARARARGPDPTVKPSAWPRQASAPAEAP